MIPVRRRELVDTDNLDYDDSVIGPKSKKQEIFLNSDADITVFGGK